MRMQIDDVSDEHQLAQVKRSLQDEFRAVTPEDLDRVADTAYRRLASGATVRTYLPILAERKARETLRDLQPTH